MSRFGLELPTIQNWSCHNCGGCCKQHGIYITDEEHDRIEKQNWTEQDGIPAGQPLFVRMGGLIGKRWWRLAHQPDGSCAFLDEKGLCRIHGKFGEEAKPLACRIYPYAFHPAGKKVVVSLRFSCPSVVKNLGRPVKQQSADLKGIARQIVPDNVTELPPPMVSPGTNVTWPDLQRFVAALDETLAGEDPVVIKLLRALAWMKLVEQSRFDKIEGGRLTEYLNLICTAAEEDVPTDLTELADTLGEPSRIGGAPFRLLVGHYARKDTYADETGLGERWRLLRNVLRFTRGTGEIPLVQDCFGPATFESLQGPFGPIPQDAEEIFTRYFRVKVRGMHFCGRAYYGIPLIEGFYSLVLVYPAVLWLARWLATGDGRDSLTTDDIAQALAIADHHHGYSPAFGTWGFRRRVRTLAQLGDIPRLCVYYSR
ncbi:MAG: YkgJ family cysteine cluster protein [Planctomycetota bacterium]|nr:MAG: YkgJ family cysteine cluster protein [Planctomycetota bacterium]REJ94673.1 MAG: YkgJ family cysteine cluster protein [Planctomycetota bacterium]REK31368.1 MAG: YkgJ family cysteine cluster protein [Planctomycetota bacterium]REK39092.1 MAG: YkgJ family cysteine cluster protein [Planctomycetota bacterium]